MGKPWLSLSEQQLDELSLDEEASSEGHQQPSSRPQCLSGPAHEVLLVLVAAFTGASFLLLQRATMVLTDTIRHSLQLDLSDMSWMSASSGLTGAIFLLPIANIADRCPTISRKAILIFAIMLFSVSMGLTALTNNGIVLDIILGVAGLACAAHIPIMSSILTSIYACPSTRRHCVLTSFLAGGNAFAVVFGGVGSGIVNTAIDGDWRGSFVYIAVLYALIAVVAALVIPNMPRSHSMIAIASSPEDRYSLLGHPVVERSSWADWRPVLSSIDWVGLLVIFAGVGCLSAGLSMGSEGDWRDSWVFLPLACSVGCFIGFFTWEGYTKKPLIPASILDCSSLVMTLISTFCISLAFSSSLFWVSFFMQDVQQLSPLEVGLRQLPQAVTGLIFSPMVGCWMHKIDNMFFVVAAALCHVCAGTLLLFLQKDSNYFAFVFPSMILSTLSMDWARNVGAQYIIQFLPFNEQMVGAAILQLVIRLAIPLGIGITSAIWSSQAPSPNVSAKDFDTTSATTLQLNYSHVFIATLSFAAIAFVVAPFARLGKLGVASTATNPSLPHTDTGLKTLNLDGGGYGGYVPKKNSSGSTSTGLTRYKIQPRNSSLLATGLNGLRRTSTGSTSFHLPRIGGSRSSGDTSGLGLEFGNTNTEDSKLQRTSIAAMTERVIWLVCEDCGASKRIVETVGDPERYFYDSNDDEDSGARKTAQEVALTPSMPSSHHSSECHELEGSVAEIGVVVDRRRFELVNRPKSRLCAPAQAGGG